MLRTLVLVLALGAPSLAVAQQFPESPMHQEVRGHDGTALGRIESVQRDERGVIVGVEVPGLEPGSAPRASRDLVARNTRGNPFDIVRARFSDRTIPASNQRLRTR